LAITAISRRETPAQSAQIDGHGQSAPFSGCKIWYNLEHIAALARFGPRHMESVFTEFQRLNGTTWFYLSTLLGMAVFFKFTRFFCLRNWDLITLFLLVPGLLATAKVDRQMLQILDDARDKSSVSSKSPKIELKADSLRDLQHGYLWLFAATGYLIVRCLVDLFLARRPRLDPNLSMAGLVWLGASLLAFLIFEALTREPDPAGRASASVAATVFNGKSEMVPYESEAGPLNPGTTFYHAVVFVAVDTLMQRVQNDRSLLEPSEVVVGVARSAAITTHVLIIVALAMIGWRHFGSPLTGIGMATLYLLTPLTAINIAKIDQLLPVTLMLWAVYFYQQPRLAGIFLGLSCVFLYPVFLLPLWLGFYGKRGAWKCFTGLAISGAALAVVLILSDSIRDFTSLWSSAVVWQPERLGSSGQAMSFWTEKTQFYRLPIFVLFMFTAIAVSFWPREKNLAELIALSMLLILGVQFWCPERGGTYIHWYLPFFLLMMFRPNLQNALPLEFPAKRAKAI
jgi:hypothetical protein